MTREIAYDSSSKPLTIVAVLHGARDIMQILKDLD
jgi:plasmid stabilization system protein ParE